MPLDGAKYILAFSEANASRENKGAFFTIDAQGNYLSRSAEMNISDPIAFKQADKDAYLVNNSSSDRYTVDLTTGKIHSLKAPQQKKSQSFTLHTNGDYVIYDVAADYTKPQQLVYWKQTDANAKKSSQFQMALPSPFIFIRILPIFPHQILTLHNTFIK